MAVTIVNLQIRRQRGSQEERTTMHGGRLAEIKLISPICGMAGLGIEGLILGLLGELG